jgi:hypothetical protein
VISFRSRIVVLVNWAWDYLFYDRPIRLIVRANQGGATGTGSAWPGALSGDVPPQEDLPSQTGPTRG